VRFASLGGRLLQGGGAGDSLGSIRAHRGVQKPQFEALPYRKRRRGQLYSNSLTLERLPASLSTRSSLRAERSRRPRRKDRAGTASWLRPGDSRSWPSCSSWKALVGRFGRCCGDCRVAFDRRQRSMAHLFAVPLLATPAPARRVNDAGATAAAARVFGHLQLHDVGVAAFCTARKSQARKGHLVVPQT
jgi:hypothetical protein